MQLKHCSVHEAAGGFQVEMLFADSDDPEEATATVAIDVPAKPDTEFPRLAELYLEALRTARNAIGDEIHRLEQSRGRV